MSFGAVDTSGRSGNGRGITSQRSPAMQITFCRQDSSRDWNLPPCSGRDGMINVGVDEDRLDRNGCVAASADH